MYLLKVRFKRVQILLIPTHCLLHPAEFPVPPFLDVVKHTDSSSPPEHVDHQHKVKNQHQNQQSSDDKQHDTHHTGTDTVLSAVSAGDSLKELRGFHQVCNPPDLTCKLQTKDVILNLVIFQTVPNFLILQSHIHRLLL